MAPLPFGREDASDDGNDADTTESELLTDRAPGPVEWLLLTGTRGVVASGLLLAILVLLTVLLAAGVVATANGGFLVRLFAGFVGGNVTLVTVVISINQLIISREFSPPGELESDVLGAVEYRQDVASLVDTAASPATPTGFLGFLVVLLRDEAAALRSATDALPESVRADVDPFAATLAGQADDLEASLAGDPSDPFETLLAVLDANFSMALHAGRRLQAVHGRSLTPAADSRLETVLEILEHVGVARQHMKTLYFQRALTSLSREILYAGLPTLVLLVVTILVLSGDGGPTVDGRALDALVLVTATASFAPLAVFSAHVFRIATITRRTGALLPFVMDPAVS